MTAEAAGTACIAAYALGLLAARAGGTRALPRVPAGRQLWLSGASLLAGYAVLLAAETTALAFAAAVLLGAGVGQLLPLGMARAAMAVTVRLSACTLMPARPSALRCR